MKFPIPINIQTYSDGSNIFHITNKSTQITQIGLQLCDAVACINMGRLVHSADYAATVMKQCTNMSP